MATSPERVVRAHLRSFDCASVSPGAVLQDASRSEALRGRAAIAAHFAETFAPFSEQAIHIDALGRMPTGQVVAEFVFEGLHSGWLLGSPPTGLRVRLPMVGIYSVSGTRIRRARLYYDGATIRRQLFLPAPASRLPRSDANPKEREEFGNSERGN